MHSTEAVPQIRVARSAVPRRRAARTLLAHLPLAVLSAIFSIPFLWLVLTSLKPNDQIFAWPPVIIPRPFTLEHYIVGFQSFPFWRFLWNTVFISVLSAAGTVLSSSLVAYSLARIRWPGAGILLAVTLAAMMLPSQVTLIPTFLLWRKLGLVNTPWPLIIPHFLFSPFHVFMLRQFFLTIPQELSEAARIDGAAEWQIYSRILLPLAKPALVTVALFSFMGSWNDFLGPLIYLGSQDQYTLSIGLAMFRGQYGSMWGEMMAMSTVMILPIIVLFFLMQRLFIQGITLTGIKG